MGAQEKHGGIRASRTKAAALEMEPMTIAESSEERSAGSASCSRLHSLITLVKLHMQYYPGITSCLAAIVVAVTVLSIALSFRSKPSYSRNQLFRDYSQMDLHHNYKASQVDHWCLWGGNNVCQCDDFTTPLSREEKKGWIQTHFRNTQRIDDTKEYDVVFVGDEVVEGWNGVWLGKPWIPSAESFQTKSYFTETFTRQGGGEFEGLALGLMGDVSPNVLWRLRHGEMPNTMQSKVFWLMTGMNDLVRGGCSEEVTMLGILRLADEIYFSNPDSIIVIQGILPWSEHSDGSLAPPKPKKVQHLLGRDKNVKAQAYKSIQSALKNAGLWPSIQRINAELAKFCAEHEHLVFFDASELFLGTMGNQVYQSKDEHIITALLSEGKKLTSEGYRVLGDAIKEELERIIYDENEENDVESRDGQRLLSVSE